MSVVIKAENLSKAYQIGEFSTGTLSQDIERIWHRVRGKEDPFLKIGEANDRTQKGETNVVWSLKDLGFEIQQGEAVGIIGRNGAGKSTLLKILSRVTTPTAGVVKIKGRIASLLEVGTGFHPELTGRENIFLNGAILGMRKHEIKKQFDEIVSFSGVERYIDTPVKRYSSGMYVRLAFGVAAHLESEVLIVDEVLAVGDAEFQKKCLGKMNDVSKNEGRTVLFVSHNLQAVSTLTSRCIFLKSGKLISDGLTADVIHKYVNNENDNGLIYYDHIDSDEPKITSVKLVTSYDNNVHIHGEQMVIEVEVTLPVALKNGALSIQAFNSLEIPLVHFWIFNSENESFKKAGVNKIQFVIPRFRLFFGKYSLTLYLADQGGHELLHKIEKVCPFEIVMFNTIHDHPWREGTCTYLEEYFCQLG